MILTKIFRNNEVEYSNKLYFSLDYPDVVTIQSESIAADLYWKELGVFIRLAGIEQNGRPVWKHSSTGGFYLFFNGW